jgi:hypothetical protein
MVLILGCPKIRQSKANKKFNVKNIPLGKIK